MTIAPHESSQPRTLTEAVKARQVRRGVGEHAKAEDSQVRDAAGEKARPAASTGTGTAPNGADGDQSLLSRLITPLKQLGRKLLDVLDEVLGDRAGALRKLGAVVLTGVVAKRLPGPLRWLAGLLSSALTGERGFGFWWVIVTVGVALLVGALVALLISPVAGLIALLVVAIWMLFRRGGDKDDEHDRARDSGRNVEGGREGEPASAPA